MEIYFFKLCCNNILGQKCLFREQINKWTPWKNGVLFDIVPTVIETIASSRILEYIIA